MNELELAQHRAQLIAASVRARIDIAARDAIVGSGIRPDYQHNLQPLAISPESWGHISRQNIDPRLVFAHPEILKELPQSSIHYRGITTLSLKRVQQLVGSVDRWEDFSPGASKPRVTDEKALKVSVLYNAVTSSIITGTTEWTLDNGYRNILATIGITQDGRLRNVIGQEAERAVKGKIADWLSNQSDLESEKVSENEYLLGQGAEIAMRFGSEPDILFRRTDGGHQDVHDYAATIEIKGGTDPAGALERLGAIKKSFDQTPAQCKNFLIVGVVTDEMKRQLQDMHVEQTYMLAEVLHDDRVWRGFLNDVFHHTLRLLGAPLDERTTC